MSRSDERFIGKMFPCTVLLLVLVQTVFTLIVVCSGTRENFEAV